MSDLARLQQDSELYDRAVAKTARSRGTSVAGARGILAEREHDPENECPVDYDRSVPLLAAGRLRLPLINVLSGLVCVAVVFFALWMLATGIGGVASYLRHVASTVPASELSAIPYTYNLSASASHGILPEMSDPSAVTSVTALVLVVALHVAAVMVAPLVVTRAVYRGLRRLFRIPEPISLVDGREAAAVSPVTPAHAHRHNRAWGAIRPDPYDTPDFTSPQSRLNDLLAEYARTEADPHTSLECPAIRDVRYPTTAAFHTAISHATEMSPEAASGRGAAPTTMRIREFTAAVDAAESAWEVAMDVAYAVGLNGLDFREKRRADALLEKVHAVAGVTDAERRQARDQLVGYLNRVVDDNGVRLSGERVMTDHLEHVELELPTRRMLMSAHVDGQD